MCLGGIFDYEQKKERLAEVELELGESAVWDDPDRAQALGVLQPPYQSVEVLAPIPRLDVVKLGQLHGQH